MSYGIGVVYRAVTKMPGILLFVLTNSLAPPVSQAIMVQLAMIFIFHFFKNVNSDNLNKWELNERTSKKSKMIAYTFVNVRNINI
jgi:hypothetical protein